jgi:hypothetical protein
LLGLATSRIAVSARLVRFGESFRPDALGIADEHPKTPKGPSIDEPFCV